MSPSAYRKLLAPVTTRSHKFWILSIGTPVTKSSRLRMLIDSGAWASDGRSRAGSCTTVVRTARGVAILGHGVTG